jgi:hypothetical protein
MRALLLAVAVAMPIEAALAHLPASGTMLVTICTAEGPKQLALDRDGKPVAPARRDPAGCAHLWCEVRRPRPGGRSG